MSLINTKMYRMDRLIEKSLKLVFSIEKKHSGARTKIEPIKKN